MVEENKKDTDFFIKHALLVWFQVTFVLRSGFYIEHFP